MWTVPAHRNCYILHTCSRTCGATGRTKASNRLPQLCEGRCPGCNRLVGEGCLKLQLPWQKHVQSWQGQSNGPYAAQWFKHGVHICIWHGGRCRKYWPSHQDWLSKFSGRVSPNVWESWTRWKKSRRYMCVHCTCSLWFMYKYFRCIVSDNCVFTYILVQAFSCIQSQISNMLLSGVRDWQERESRESYNSSRQCGGMCTHTYLASAGGKPSWNTLRKSYMHQRQLLESAVMCAQTQHQYTITKQRWQPFLQQFRKSPKEEKRRWGVWFASFHCIVRSVSRTLECHQNDTSCFSLLGSRVDQRITDPIS